MKFWEVDCVPFLQRPPVKVSLANLGPATSQCVENANLDVGWIKFRTITSILESNSFKAYVLSKFDHDPWPAMVGRIPFIPILFARTEQVLKIWFSSDKYVMLSCHFSSIVKVVPFKSARNHFSCYHTNLHLLLLLNRLNDNLNWLLTHHLTLRLVENNFTKLNFIGSMIVVKVE